MEEAVRPKHPRPVSCPPSVVLALFVVVSIFGSGVYVLIFYLK